MSIKSWLLPASTSLRLPIYKDPFDRLLVAPLAVEGVLLVTTDPDIAQYPGAVRKVRGSVPNRVYDLFVKAITGRKQILCTYDGYPCELCPHILGHAKGEEVATKSRVFAQTSVLLGGLRVNSLAALTGRACLF